MKIELLGWQSEGLRCPDLNIDFTVGGRVPKVALLQMPNGVGKTTTLSCLRGALDGSAIHWKPDYVRNFRSSDQAVDKGTFIVRLLVNGSERLTIELTFHFEDGIVSYRTTYGMRQSTGFTPPPTVAMFLNPRFAKLFIFDGELAAQLLKEHGEDAGAVIDTFYQLYLLEDMKQLAQRELEDHIRHQRAPNPAAVDRLDREIKNLDKHFTDLATRAREFEKKRREHEARIAELEQEVGERIRANEQFRERESKAEADLQAATHKLEFNLQALSASLPNPSFINPGFELALKNFAASLDRLKLPDPSSKAFFTELLEEAECICGRKMDDDARQHIRARAADILADETAGFLNALKDDVRHGTLPEPRFVDVIATLRNITEQIGEAQQRKDAIRSLLAAKGDIEIQQRQEELQRFKTELADFQAFLREYEREPLPTDRIECECKKWFERELAAKRKQLAELTGSLEFKNKTDILQNILSAAYSASHEALKNQVVNAANERLDGVLKFSPVRIADISSTIQLAGPSGAAQAGASVGQTLAIGYVFLTTLLNGAAHQFPLVVDSPAGPMDYTVRREVAPLVPALSSQFVALTISTEREGFVDTLAAAADDDVKYLTAFRQTPNTKDLMDALPASGVTKTSNGVLVEGKEYFFAFDLEEA